MNARTLLVALLIGVASNTYGAEKPGVGALAVDSNFSKYGDYLQELIETVQAEWDRELAGISAPPKDGLHVYIQFRLNSDGMISDLEVTDETAGEVGTAICRAAIQNPQPYRPWTKAMIDALGKEQTLRFRFHYGPPQNGLLSVHSPASAGKPVPRPRPKVVSSEAQQVQKSAVRIKLGMSVKDLVSQMGKPASRARTVSEEGVTEVLSYSKRTFTFKDGKLKSWTEFE